MNRPRLLRIFFFLFLLAGSVRPLWADFQIPEKPDGYVTDRAGLLSAVSRDRLESQLDEFQRRTSTQVVVATFPSLEGGSLEDVSIHIAQKWKVGQKGRDNGVIFLIFKEDRRMRIEVGYGLESVLTDAVSSQIIRHVVVPQFVAKNYEQGILDGVNTILAVTQGEYQPLSMKEKDGSAFWVVFFLVGIIFVIDLIRYGVYRGQNRGYAGCYGFWEWFFLFAILWLILRALLTSRSGGSWSSGGRGGYSSGGGFGGGGASGRW